MTARSPSAFFFSAGMHALVVVVLVLFSVVFNKSEDKAPKVFELVAGEGDNYMATEAPALGTPGGARVEVPAPPTPKIERAPAAPAPEPVVQRAPAKPEPVVPDLSRSVKRIANKREARIVNQYRKEVEAERRAEERRKKEEALKSKRITEEEFRRMNKGAPPANSKSTTKLRHIDTDGIVKGVIGGSTANKVGGAGGTALTREEGDAIDGYTALLAQKIKAELDERPGVGAGLIVEVELRIMADGSLRNVSVTKSSGSREFDQAVLEALGKIQMPPRPAGLSEFQRFPIRGVADE
ncbi:MAG TPA: energy transducer TonB [Opitutus sp.]|nr:energy transducer TonB [Opitutus sp.]